MASRTNVLRILLMLGGIVIAVWASVVLLALDHVALGKFSTAARDTNGAILFLLIGIAVFVHGLGMSSDTADKDVGDGDQDQDQ